MVSYLPTAAWPSCPGRTSPPQAGTTYNKRFVLCRYAPSAFGNPGSPVDPTPLTPGFTNRQTLKAIARLTPKNKGNTRRVTRPQNSQRLEDSPIWLHRITPLHPAGNQAQVPARPSPPRAEGCCTDQHGMRIGTMNRTGFGREVYHQESWHLRLTGYYQFGRVNFGSL